MQTDNSITQLNTIADISEYVKVNDLVLLDFWAPWCGPCRSMEPVLKELALEQSTVKIAKVNVDEVADVSETFKIRSVPMLVLMKNNEIVKSKTGAIDKTSLRKFITEA